MWMETILLRGTLESENIAFNALSELLSSMSDEEDLDSINLFQRHPEFGDIFVEVRWNSAETPHQTRLGTMISRLLESHGSIQHVLWKLRGETK